MLKFLEKNERRDARVRGVRKAPKVALQPPSRANASRRFLCAPTQAKPNPSNSGANRWHVALCATWKLTQDATVAPCRATQVATVATWNLGKLSTDQRAGRNPLWLQRSLDIALSPQQDDWSFAKALGTCLLCLTLVYRNRPKATS